MCAPFTQARRHQDDRSLHSKVNRCAMAQSKHRKCRIPPRSETLLNRVSDGPSVYQKETVARSAQRISLWQDYLVASSYAYGAHRRRYKDLPSAPQDRSSSVDRPRSRLGRAEPAPALVPLRGSRIGGQEKMVTLQPGATLLPLPRSSIPNSLSTKNLRIDGFDGSVNCRRSTSSRDFAPFQPQCNLARATDRHLQALRASGESDRPGV